MAAYPDPQPSRFWWNRETVTRKSFFVHERISGFGGIRKFSHVQKITPSRMALPASGQPRRGPQQWGGTEGRSIWRQKTKKVKFIYPSHTYHEVPWKSLDLPCFPARLRVSKEREKEKKTISSFSSWDLIWLFQKYQHCAYLDSGYLLVFSNSNCESFQIRIERSSSREGRAKKLPRTHTCPGSGERQGWRGGKGHDGHTGMIYNRAQGEVRKPKCQRTEG
jgi:hypothetical protein